MKTVLTAVPAWTALPLVWMLLLGQACALTAGAGVNLSVDTRGRIALMATVSVDPSAVRVEPKKTPENEQSVSFLPLAVAVSGGIELNPGASILRVEAPGIGYTWNHIQDDGQGVVGRISPRFDLRWPFDGKFNLAVGGAIRGGWMSHLSLVQHDRLPSRPEWPDGWAIHQIGPQGEFAVMHDDKGWFAQFGAGFQYWYQDYFYIGL